MFYTFSFLSALLSLVLWFFFKKNEGLGNLFSKLFFCSIFVYAGSILMADATVAYKFQTAFRDLMVLSISAILVNTFGINKQIFMGLAAGIGMVLSVFFLPMFQETFPEKKAASTDIFTTNLDTKNKVSNQTIPLDKNGELLVEIKENHQFSELRNLLDKYQLSYQRAFQMQDESSTDLDDYFVVNIPVLPLKKLKQIFTQVVWSIGLKKTRKFPLTPSKVEPPRLPKKSMASMTPPLSIYGVLKPWKLINYTAF